MLFRSVRSEYGLFDMGDGSMDSITVAQTVKAGEETLLYVFDIRKDIPILAFCSSTNARFASLVSSVISMW